MLAHEGQMLVIAPVVLFRRKEELRFDFLGSPVLGDELYGSSALATPLLHQAALGLPVSTEGKARIFMSAAMDSIGLESPRDLICDLEAAMGELPVVVDQLGALDLLAVRGDG